MHIWVLNHRTRYKVLGERDREGEKREGGREGEGERYYFNLSLSHTTKPKARSQKNTQAKCRCKIVTFELEPDQKLTAITCKITIFSTQ